MNELEQALADDAKIRKDQGAGPTLKLPPDQDVVAPPGDLTYAPTPEDGLLLVVVAAVKVNGRYLVAKRSAKREFPSQWEFPGGKVKPGEDRRMALFRELKEEVGINPARCWAPDLIAEQLFEPPMIKQPTLITGYKVHYHPVLGNGSELKALEDQQEIKLVSLQEMLQMDLTPGTRFLLGSLLVEDATKPEATVRAGQKWCSIGGHPMSSGHIYGVGDGTKTGVDGQFACESCYKAWFPSTDRQPLPVSDLVQEGDPPRPVHPGKPNNLAQLAEQVMEQSMKNLLEDLKHLDSRRVQRGSPSEHEVAPLVQMIKLANEARLLRDALNAMEGISRP